MKNRQSDRRQGDRRKQQIAVKINRRGQSRRTGLDRRKRRSILPKFILENYDNSNFNGKFLATTMFIDISGFTKMTQILMKNGKEGAEILTQVINEVFTPSIDAIYNSGGFISTFAGDAFTAIFPIEKTNSNETLLSAKKINDIFIEIGTQNTKFGDFELSVKIGLSSGNVEWGIIENDIQNAYYFKGNAIENSADSEHKCQKGDIVIDENIFKKLDSEIESIELGDGYYKITNLKFNKTSFVPKPVKKNQIDVSSFIPQSILDLNTQGEFRDIVSCFISFNENNFESYISQVISLADQYGGFFNKVDFGDKGAVALILFGAPVGLEKAIERACTFALAINNLDGFSMRAGLTFGTVFAGIIGSEKRCEYTALGMGVNLSARFMMSANWGDLYLDKHINSNIENNFKTDFLSEQHFKGFVADIPVYSLIGKIEQTSELSFEGKLFGRQKELDELNKYIEPLNNGKFAGVVYVDGSVGIGKSRIVNELKKAQDLSNLNWFSFPCDDILRKNFNPVINFLKRYFEQSVSSSAIENRNNFDNKLELLIQSLNDELLCEELNRTKSFLGALIGLRWESSLFEQLDAKGKYVNTLFAVSNLIKAESLIKPVIIELDDGHSIDEDSNEFLRVLTRDANDYPLLIISSCRYKDDGSKHWFGLEDVPENRVVLDYLSKKNAKELTRTKLLQFTENKDVVLPHRTFEPIWKVSEGNPFYIEQIVLYLLENNLVDEKLYLTQEDFEIPSSINAIVITRIDKLTAELKEIIQTASVLGKEFAVDILSEMLGNTVNDKYLSDGEEEAIWGALSQYKYIFKHALIQEGIYQMQLKQRLRKLHKLAAETIESLYSDNLEHYYTELVNHYEISEIKSKTVKYLIKAGDYAKENYQNQSAINFYNRLLYMIPNEKESNQYQQALLNKIEVMLHIGTTYKAKEELSTLKPSMMFNDVLRDQYYYLNTRIYVISGKDFDRLKLYIEKNQNYITSKRYQKQINQAYLTALDKLNLSVDFEEISTELINKSEKVGDQISVGKLSSTIGNYYFRRADYTNALLHYQKENEIAEKLKDKQLLRRSLHDLGIVQFRLGNLDNSMIFLEQAFEIAKEIGDNEGCCIITMDIANVRITQGNYETGIQDYKQSLVSAKKVGNKVQQGKILYNIGNAYFVENKLENALKFLNLSKELCRKIADNIGITFANDLLGDIRFKQSKIDEAELIYSENLNIQTELKDSEGIAHTYGNLGNVARKRNDFTKAEDYYTKQQELLAEVGDINGEGRVFYNLGMMFAEIGKIELVIPNLKKALKLFEDCSFQAGIDIAKEQIIFFGKITEITELTSEQISKIVLHYDDPVQGIIDDESSIIKKFSLSSKTAQQLVNISKQVINKQTK
ncbi:MAG: tetratricopeptide repeat protein [Candidatus Marinimicrobia bacterium]|nr:tetratricopeptide repeat protein [Candidatus Neomarinimicrobiota bacterium]MBL7023530.1 tetratricopeptide repeat protein [Candidatus Neomarinimicrobiota bacterium]MBL7109432.1 tetratricopeptide repeat protein [Candidatus Neomarinimicrobiota bacterium]